MLSISAYLLCLYHHTDLLDAAKKHYIVSRYRVRDFVGREDQLRKILAYFTSDRLPQHVAPKILILYALGGQGKSQLALEYCQRSRDLYRGIFWIQASSKSLATQSYERIAMELMSGVYSSLQGNTEATISLVKAELEAWNERWLLVFDNYDEPDKFRDIRNFIPLGIFPS